MAPVFASSKVLLASLIVSCIFTGNFLDWEARIYNQINARENWCLCMGFAEHVTQTMQVPLTYAEDIIGSRGSNIAYICHTSGAILTVQENRGFYNEIVIEIKGSTSQVQTAQQLIQFISSHKEPPSMYRENDTGSSLYSDTPEASYPWSSFASNVGGH